MSTILESVIKRLATEVERCSSKTDKNHDMTRLLCLMETYLYKSLRPVIVAVGVLMFLILAIQLTDLSYTYKVYQRIKKMADISVPNVKMVD